MKMMQGGLLLALLKEVADAARADTNEHLNKVGAGDGEEGDARLARDAARQERLARARGAHQQHTLGDSSAEAGELLGVSQELDDLLKLLLGLFDARDVFEGYLVVRLIQQPGLRLAEAHRLAAALHLAHEEVEDGEDKEHREQRAQDGAPHAGLLPLEAELGGLGRHEVLQVVGHAAHRLEGCHLLEAERLGLLGLDLALDLAVVVDDDIADGAHLDGFAEGREGDLAVRLRIRGDQLHHEDRDRDENCPKKNGTLRLLHANLPVGVW